MNGVTTTPDPMQTIGPGRVIAVVGPSGAGKDTLIRLAASLVPEAVVQLRVVTRPSTADEPNEEMTPVAFEKACAAGAFALHWEAHGLKYGLPRTMDERVRAGKTVVVNISRKMVDALRRRYARVTTVLVTAPEEVLRARLEGRRRPADGSLAERLRRASHAGDFQADIVINNVGAPAEMAAPLVAAMRGR